MPGRGAIADKRNEKAAVKKGGAKKKKIDSEDEAYVANKAGKEKKEKDPDMPKKPQTSYFLFMNAKRPQVKADEPNLGFGELTKKLTQMWKDLDDEARKEYEDLAVKDKQRYQKEMEAKGLAKKPKVVDSEAPKKAQSAFFLYSAEARDKIKKEQTEMKQADILKKIGAEWKALSDAEKKKWEEKAKADKERYEREMAEYKGGADASAGSKRPANKGQTASTKKARKDT